MPSTPSETLPDLLPPVTLGDLTIRELPPEDWDRLSEASGPLSGHLLPATDSARIIVAETDDRIVAYWVAAAMVHLDPLWVDPDLRHHPRLGFAFLGALVRLLQSAGVTYAYAIIGDGDQPANGQLAEKLGLSRVPGTLYGGAIPRSE